MIHPTAIIGNDVNLGSDVKIGPYVIIDGNVTIGKNTEIHASSILWKRISSNNLSSK